MKKHLMSLGLAGLAITGSVAQAEEFLDDRFYVAPFGTYLQPGGNTNGYGGWGAGVGFGKILDEHFNVEVRGFWQNYQSDRVNPGVGNSNAANTLWNGKTGNWNGQTDLTGGTIDGQFYFFRDTISPYIVAGIGGMNTSGPQPWTKFAAAASVASFIFETGVGATYEVLDNLLIRADVRYRINTAPTTGGSTYTTASGATVSNSGSGVLNDMLVNVGFVIPFGDKPKPTALAAAPVAAAKNDCATRDTDHDGVNDCDDKCPGTLAGAQVDAQGCPVIIELKGVHFKYDSSELLPESKKILDGVAQNLIEYPTKHEIEVVGHTSTEGSDDYNLHLSQRRSASVVEYLKWAGVKNKLHAVGMGESHPLIPHERDEAERAKNRRVQLVWQGEADYKTR
ncbi:OmpA family protein [Candidatus Methylospira mobilis]|uniref:OmpA family protein n=1 Tax=Candidatus Methylospira mobilis TaxID=1808979 RepID=A0A5Q0BI53_9GAMM|nr:OmpA family protein [Candidatus Methylospira mobilis]QFY43510.1 OmpA family protein [Candidatus Methylospira mobilis]WNV03948.1 OmpA family protein [Candidatus Methylospira mobilis]